MSAFKYFILLCHAQHAVGEELLPERTVSVKEAQRGDDSSQHTHGTLANTVISLSEVVVNGHNVNIIEASLS